jgi:hypothetical protein
MPNLNASQLTAIICSHRLAIDEWRGGAGKFRDLYVGTGKPVDVLLRAQEELASHNVTSKLTHVSNREHPDYGKPMLEIPSFWWT